MLHALIVAAGRGQRFGAALPKQYLPLLGAPVLWHTLSVFCAHPAIARVSAILSPDDTDFGRPEWQPLWLSLGAKFEAFFCGGTRRDESVAQGLFALEPSMGDDDWVLVHDAARPCLSPQLLDRLIAEVGDDPVGGLLATPVADTLKRADDTGRIVQTLPRQNVWRAQTPQMFRYGLLKAALSAHPGHSDEAAALEAAGHAPRLVEGANSNLKITYPPDLGLAEWILRNQTSQTPPQEPKNA
ncbi:MAG: 2-C-methyl-D-erythritol 4-phosphate cytidylyltransferase [Zoogloeaceae bacterium]|jgi:2-C-methyl-D-erythritol 4-phosphate cytidylyltransferase|nr:2-C-methyl-D-erythritol 4-phosphate cytidylyltransferase [Zoogloeaceae bacterium]